MNGVCVCCKGWLDLDKLEGIALIEYDPERAAIEEAFRRESVERYRQHYKQFYPIDKSIVNTRPINDKPEQSDSVSIIHYFACSKTLSFPFFIYQLQIHSLTKRLPKLSNLILVFSIKFDTHTHF